MVRVLEDEVERGVTRADDGDGPEMDLGALDVREPVALAEGLQLPHDKGEGLVAVRLDVDHEHERLVRVYVKDAVAAAVVEGRVGVVPREDVDQGVDVERCERTVACQRRRVVADVQLVVEQPHVGLDARAPGMYRREQGHLAPVVVVAVAGDRHHVPQKVGRVPGEAFGPRSGTAPVVEDAVRVVVPLVPVVVEHEDDVDEQEEAAASLGQRAKVLGINPGRRAPRWRTRTAGAGAPDLQEHKAACRKTQEAPPPPMARAPNICRGALGQ